MTATTATKSISNGVDKTEAIVPVGTKGRKAKDYYDFTSDQMRKDLIRYYCSFKRAKLRQAYRKTLEEKKIECINWSVIGYCSKRELVAMLTTLELTKMVILPERIYNWGMTQYSSIDDSDLRERLTHSILFYKNTLSTGQEPLESAISGFDDAQLTAITKDCWYIYVQGELIEADNTEAVWNDVVQQSRINSEKRREAQKKKREEERENNQEAGTFKGIVIPPEYAKVLAHELKTLALHTLQTCGPNTLPFRMAIKVIDEVIPSLVELNLNARENK